MDLLMVVALSQVDQGFPAKTRIFHMKHSAERITLLLSAANDRSARRICLGEAGGYHSGNKGPE
jgi:hypothetical protein